MIEFEENIMNAIADEAGRTSSLGLGGPFGAAIVRQIEGQHKEVIIATNTVLESHDPTAHAEINAIRKASKQFGTHDLSDCVIYATSSPCPMCRAAIMWANIKTVYYGNTAKDTSKIGFRDDFMYKYFENSCKDEQVMKMTRVHSEKCVNLLSEYSTNQGQLY